MVNLLTKKTSPYSYTMKTIVTISNWNKRCNNEYQRIKKLTIRGKNSRWITRRSPDDGSYWENDPIIYLPGMGKTTSDRIHSLNEAIVIINDLQNNTSENLATIRGINGFISLSRLAIRRDCPFEDENHRKENNLYESKFRDDW